MPRLGLKTAGGVPFLRRWRAIGAERAVTASPTRLALRSEALALGGRGSLGHQPPLAQGSGLLDSWPSQTQRQHPTRPCNNRNGSSHTLWSSKGWPGPSAKRTTRIISLIVAAAAEEVQLCSPGKARQGG